MEKRDNSKALTKNLFTSCVLGAFAGIILTILLLYLFALLIEREAIPMALGNEAVLVSAFLGATAGSVFAVRRQGRGVMQTGLITGTSYLIIVLLISALHPNGVVLSAMTLKILICSLTGGAFGGALCLNRRRRNRPAKRRNYTKRNQ